MHMWLLSCLSLFAGCMNICHATLEPGDRSLTCRANQLSGSSDAVLAYAAETRCPASCRSLARVHFSSRQKKNPVICRLEVRRAILGNQSIVIVPAARCIKVHPISDDISSFSAISKSITVILSLSIWLSVVDFIACETDIRKRKAR